MRGPAQHGRWVMGGWYIMWGRRSVGASAAASQAQAGLGMGDGPARRLPASPKRGSACRLCARGTTLHPPRHAPRRRRRSLQLGGTAASALLPHHGSERLAGGGVPLPFRTPQARSQLGGGLGGGVGPASMARSSFADLTALPRGLPHAASTNMLADLSASADMVADTPTAVSAAGAALAFGAFGGGSGASVGGGTTATAFASAGAHRCACWPGCERWLLPAPELALAPPPGPPPNPAGPAICCWPKLCSGKTTRALSRPGRAACPAWQRLPRLTCRPACLLPRAAVVDTSSMPMGGEVTGTFETAGPPQVRAAPISSPRCRCVRCPLSALFPAPLGRLLGWGPGRAASLPAGRSTGAAPQLLAPLLCARMYGYLCIPRTWHHQCHPLLCARSQCA